MLLILQPGHTIIGLCVRRPAVPVYITLPSGMILAQLLQPVNFLLAQRDLVEPPWQNRVGDEEIDLHVASSVTIGLLVPRKLEKLAVFPFNDGPAGSTAGNEFDQRGRVAIAPAQSFFKRLGLAQSRIHASVILDPLDSGKVWGG